MSDKVGQVVAVPWLPPSDWDFGKPQEWNFQVRR